MTSALAQALGRLRLNGAIFLRAEYTEGWAFESVAQGGLGDLLVPGAPRVILFHLVAGGRCWVQVGDGERHWAESGDVIVLPYGDTHRMGGSRDAALVSALSLMEAPPWERMPMIRYGEGGDQTHVVCGYLTSDDPLFDPRMSALPKVFVVSPDEAAREFIRASIDYAVHQTSQVDVDRLESPTPVPEMLLVEILKLHLESAPAAQHGWLAALHDPILAPAMAAIHGHPEQKWAVADLAATSAVSVSVLDERFRSVLGIPPIRYLAGWRMHLAEELLESADLGVAAIAHRVGYDSEAAFSRAFKRAHGIGPRAWRVGPRTRL